MAKSQDRWIRTLMMGASIVALSGTAAFAQTAETDEDDVEEIVVTGFKTSLQRSQDIKKNADTFVDAITAEDIGALPDRSVAEALQRVPGVNIGRFAQADDPDRFSVEGSGVIIRGLPFVRSELNGREIFSANGGRSLSFNDVSPELLGGVEVFKNSTADKIDGDISGTVNLITRKPLDKPGLNLAGTIEGNYGDMAEEFSPGFSGLASDTWETGVGTFGAQIGYSQSNLVSRTDASQITDPCYRAASLDSGCIRVQNVGSGGLSDALNFTADTFPPTGAVIAPKGGGVRTAEYDRDRKAISAVGQWESNSGAWLATLEYLRAESDQTLDEYSILALVNDDSLFPVPVAGTTWNFDNNGVFQSGTLTQAGGIPTEMLRFQREDEAYTDDIAFDLKWTPTDRISVNIEAQKIKSDRKENGLIASMSTYSDIFIDAGGDTPDVRFLPTGGATDNQFADGGQSFYWFAIDNQVRNEGELESLRGDIDWDFGADDTFFKSARFGARWADRSRSTKNTNFSNWGALSQPWTGAEIYANDTRGGISGYSSLRNPFENFQRGEVSLPTPGGAAFFFGGDNMVQEYLNRETEAQSVEIYEATLADAVAAGTWNPAWGRIPNAWGPIYRRGGDPLIDGLYREGEVSEVDETTKAFYGRVDFGTDNFFSAGKVLEGNFGIRYVETEVNTGGQLQFPTFDTGTPLPGEPAITPENYVAVTCARIPTSVDGRPPAYCGLSPERQAEYVAAFTGELIDDSGPASYDHILPSLNVKLNMTDEVILRGAISKGISRPDLSFYRTSGSLLDNTETLRQGGTLATGPLFTVQTGNRDIKPVEGWNYDISAEWYFAAVGSLTATAFRKELSNLITYGPSVRTVTSPTGVDVRTEVLGPANLEEASMYGFEFAYQQTYDFLPGFWSGFGAQATYTYVDASDLTNSGIGATRSPFASNIGLTGVSEDTVNLTGFYEDDKLSARLAYNWRSEYAITPRDVIFPFNPVVGEGTGQLDGSIFYSITDQWKIGMQGVNLLDEITSTSQVVDFDGTEVRRSAFRNDRRVTFLARFEF